MNCPIAFDDAMEQAAPLPADGDLVAMLGKLIEHLAGRAMAARRDLRHRHLAALCKTISMLVIMLAAAVRMVLKLVTGATATCVVVLNRSSRHLHHPPQVWAAP